MTMLSLPDIYVLRHGQTQWNLQGRYQGRLDSPLTDLGRFQAAQQGVILQQIGVAGADVAFFTSPQGRALETAHVVAKTLGAAALPDDRLQEIDFGEWQGLTRLDIDNLWPHLTDDVCDKTWYLRAPGGERYEQMAARVQAFLDQLAQPTVIVTHGATSMVLRGLVLGLSQTESFALPHQQGCVYHLAAGREICLTA